MDNIVSRETIRSHIISIEDFTYRVSHIFSMLNPQVEQSHTLNQSKILLTVLVVFSQCLIPKQSIEGFIGRSILGVLGEYKGDDEEETNDVSTH